MPKSTMTEETSIAIIGAGHAGVQLAASLREYGFKDEITLIGAEPHLPYQRPPLSKLSQGTLDLRPQPLRGPAWFQQQGIALQSGVQVTALEPLANALSLSDGRTLVWKHCVLATGCQPRYLAVAGSELDGVLVLRDLNQALELRRQLRSAKRIVVIGGGFIGLEVASIAAALGLQTTVVESAPRLMARAVSVPVSEHFAKLHRARGVHILLGANVKELRGQLAKVSEVVLDDHIVPADLVLLGIGAVAADALASSSGIDCDGGLLVNGQLETNRTGVFAIGDCAAQWNPWAERRIRIESVQNAVDHAKKLARHLCGLPSVVEALPWFWSEQGEDKLQIAGLVETADDFMVKRSDCAGAFSVLGFKRNQLVCVESVNRPGDHVAARRILTTGVPTDADGLRNSPLDPRRPV
jgi:3-phenylpropionate/trans-cinnamate dioxygenase ferredoxin reductase subunit